MKNYTLSFIALIGIVLTITYLYVSLQFEKECKRQYDNGYKACYQTLSNVNQKDVRKIIIETRDSLVIIKNPFYDKN